MIDIEEDNEPTLCDNCCTNECGEEALCPYDLKIYNKIRDCRCCDHCRKDCEEDI